MAKLAGVWTVVLCSSSNTCIYGGRDYSGKHILKGDDVFLKEHAKFIKEFVKDSGDTRSLWWQFQYGFTKLIFFLRLSPRSWKRMDLWDILSMQASAISSFLKIACQSEIGSWLEMMRALRLYLSSRICSKSFCCCPSIGFISKSSMMRTSSSSSLPRSFLNVYFPMQELDGCAIILQISGY